MQRNEDGIDYRAAADFKSNALKPLAEICQAEALPMTGFSYFFAYDIVLALSFGILVSRFHRAKRDHLGALRLLFIAVSHEYPSCICMGKIIYGGNTLVNPFRVPIGQLF